MDGDRVRYLWPKNSDKRKKEKKKKKPIFQGDPVEDPPLALPYIPLTP